jgi:hypothetical protein
MCFPWKFETSCSAHFGNRSCNVKVFSLSLNTFLCSHCNTHWTLLYVWAVNFTQHSLYTFALMYYFHPHLHIKKWSVTEFCSNHSMWCKQYPWGSHSASGPPNLENTKICLGFFWAGFHSSGTKQYSISLLRYIGVLSLIIIEGTKYQVLN